MTPSMRERRLAHWNWRILGWATAAALLLIPLAAMQFTSEVNWTAFDFLFAGAMLAIVGTIAELTARLAHDNWYKAGVATAVLSAFLLIWINGAVGIIGNEGNPANLTFLAIVLMILAGALAANFSTAGMALVMALAAIAQLLVGIAALGFGLGANEPPGPVGIFAINLLFVGLWSLSSGLFRRAATEQIG